MKIILLLAVLAVSTICLPGRACAGPGHGVSYLTGNNLYMDRTASLDDPYLLLCVGYIDGIADALNGNVVNGYSACIPPLVTNDQ